MKNINFTEQDFKDLEEAVDLLEEFKKFDLKCTGTFDTSLSLLLHLKKKLIDRQGICGLETEDGFHLNVNDEIIPKCSTQADYSEGQIIPSHNFNEKDETYFIITSPLNSKQYLCKQISRTEALVEKVQHINNAGVVLI